MAPEVSVASPLVRSMARQTGLDLATIQGSGPDGAIRVSDIETALGLTTSTAPTQGSVPAATTPRPTNDTPFVEVRHSAMRRVVARRLVESKRDAPHFYLRVECAVDSLIQLRAELNARPGFPPLTINDFLVRAAVLALREVPAVNASWTEEAVRRYQQVDLAVAVAVEGGLVTPIVRDAGQASLDETAARLRDLIDRARSRSLRPEEYTGGTFTVSNLGMRGVEEIYPVINPPQAAILGIGEARERPVSRHGQVVSATTIHGTLAADHRVLDGTEAAAYLMAYKGLIEEPAILLR